MAMVANLQSESSAVSGYSACEVLNPGEDGVRRSVKRRVKTRVI